MVRRVWVAAVAAVAFVGAPVSASPVLAASSGASGPAPAVVSEVDAAQVRASQWYLDELGITRAQQVTKGAGVRICLIDRYLDKENRNLEGVQWGTFYAGSGLDWKFQHGTDMAMLLASSGRYGFQGVAPEVAIDYYSVPDEYGALVEATPGIMEKCAAAGAKVVSMSFVGGIDEKTIAFAQAHDMVLVAGAGNDGGRQESLVPAAGTFGVLSVTGTDRSLSGDGGSSWASYHTLYDPATNTGFDASDHQGVAITGPSANRRWVGDQCDGMLTEVRNQEGVYRLNHVCGTSPATAVVAGVVALVRAEHPELNAANVINRVVKTAKRPVGEKAGTVVPSPRFGFGIVDAYAAVTADVPVVQENPLGSMYTGGWGVWDSRVVPQRAEPPVGGVSEPASVADVVLDDPNSSSVRPTPMPSGRPASESPSPSESASVSASASSDAVEAGATSGVPGWVWPLALVGVLAAVGAVVAVRRRGSQR